MANSAPDNGFNVKSFLKSIKSTQPPWECPKCSKFFKSFIGIKHHLVKFHHSASSSPSNRFPNNRKSKLKFSIKKKNNRLLRRSPSPIPLSPTRDTTLTWAEAQQMVELESDGKIYRLNISDKLDILSDSEDENIIANKQFNGDDFAKTTDPTVINSKIENRKLSSCSEKKCKLKNSNSPSLLKTPSRNSTSFKENSCSTVSQLPKPSFNILLSYDKQTDDAPPRPRAYYRYIEKPPDDLEDEVEYDMDEEDAVWLELMNTHRVKDGIEPVSDNQLELLMDRFEKESYFEQAKNGHNTQTTQPLIDEDAVCCVCNDGECQNSNVILFCDMCNLAIHQECYGVPYIPEGQWLCRRCLQSPSSPVDCCLCPNRSGAFKQTDDNRWAHVVCALWIPEVGFGNTVFLEPIDDIKNIPPARWKLTCYICKQRNAGACIQCHKTNCYTAFHVTCAQQAGLFMKMEACKKNGEDGVTITVKKEAYCDAHTPKDASPREKENSSQLPNEDVKKNDKMKKARKILAEKRLEAPQVSIPYIPRDRLLSISRLVSIQKRSAFMQRLLSYWTLKRQSRNGVPLLRRLQSHVHSHKTRDPEAELEKQQLMEQLSYWQRLRHDLERARLLIELLRKREKLKREAVRAAQIITELRLTPMSMLLHRVLSKLVAFDTAKVFTQPVKESDAPDYYNVVEHPMDFSTMAAKIDDQKYKGVSNFEHDFNLIINNCIHYNGRESIFYRLATRMRDHGGTAIRAAKREVARTGFDEETGLLLPKAPEKKIEETIDDEQRLNLPLKQQLDIMLVRLDQAVLHAKKTKKIRAEISLLKRKIARENNLRKSVNEKTSKEMTSDSDSDIKNQATMSDNFQDNHKQNNDKISVSDNENATSRKKFWTKRRSLSPSEAPIKKRLLARSGSCPIPIPKHLQKTLRQSGDELSHDVLSSSENLCNTAEGIRSSSLPPSPSGSNVNRRSAVLFNKKTLWSNPIPFDIDEIPLKLDEPNDGVQTSDDEKEPASNAENHPKPEEKVENKIETASRHSDTNESDSGNEGINDDNNTKSKNRSDSVSSAGEQSHSPSSSDSEDHADDERKMDMKIRTQAIVSLVRIRDTCQSDNSTSEDSADEKPGVIIGNNAVIRDDRLHKPISASDDEQDGDVHISPLDLVWAKCWGYPPYPALLIDPNMPRSGYCHNGVPIPVPPLDVLRAGEDKRNENGNKRIYLVLFFDTKRTWQWLPRNKLEHLGMDSKADQLKLNEGKRPAVRKNVEAAYKRALLHRSKVTGEIPDSDDDITMENPPSVSDL